MPEHKTQEAEPKKRFPEMNCEERYMYYDESEKIQKDTDDRSSDRYRPCAGHGRDNDPQRTCLMGARGKMFRRSFPVRLYICAGILTAGCMFSLNTEAKEAVVSKGVYVEGVDVGGLTREELVQAIDSKVAELASARMTFRINEEDVAASLSEFGLTWSNREIVDDIMQLGASGDILKRYKDQKDIEQNRKEYHLRFQSDADRIRSYAQTFTAYEKEPVDARIYTTDDLLPGVEGGTDGIRIRVEDTAAQIAEAISGWDGVSALSMDVPVDHTKPDVPYEELAIICDPLGTATTDYSFSSYERAINVQNGCSKISGTLLYPGDYFSVTDAVTPFTAENGYEPAPSYEENRVVDSYGGGICQVSTTLYNAVLKSELEVTARSNHTMAVSYVDLSKDAAIAEGVMDMSFVNNKEDPIYIIGYAYNGTLSFTIYGHETRPANRSIELVSVTTGTMEPSSAMIYANPNQPVGYINQTQSPHTGYTAELWKNIYYDGELTESVQINSSYYNAVGTIYDVGVASSNTALTQAMYSAISTNDLSSVQAVIAGAANYGNQTPQTQTAPAADTQQVPVEVPQPAAEEVQTVPEEVQTIPEEGVITDQGLILDPALLEGGDYSQPDMDEAPQY